jgi:hypothetical protein
MAIILHAGLVASSLCTCQSDGLDQSIHRSKCPAVEGSVCDAGRLVTAFSCLLATLALHLLGLSCWIPSSKSSLLVTMVE